MKQIIILTLILFPSFKIAGQSEGLLNRLLAPGPLIEGHDDLEKSQCLKCHEAGKGISADKCMGCHTEIQKQVNAKSGFHGLATQTCIQCHSDHKGRKFDSTVVDESNFDHSKTGYRLEGKHSELKCAKCHVAKRIKKAIRPNQTRYMGAQTSCKECHIKDDPHSFSGKWAKKDCSQCHGLKTWKTEIKFDHQKDTNFALEEAHAKLKCNDCHKNSKYQWKNLAQSQCLSCHKEYHAGTFNKKWNNGDCAKCHSQQTWKITSFDHQEVTGFALKGKHQPLKCADCHKQNSKELKTNSKTFKWSGLQKACNTCHKDVHEYGDFKSQRLGSLKDCTACHSDKGWNDIHNFNHSVNTRFPIEGKHIPLDCKDCHQVKPKNSKQPGVYHWVTLSTKTCEVCHKNPHLNDPSPSFKKKRCDQCHTAEDWHSFNVKGKKFNHDQTRFKLTGKHSQINCSACHVVNKKQVFKFTDLAGEFCVDCHKTPHGGQFKEPFSSQTCKECHNTVSFREKLPFNHDLTKYKLLGSHKNLDCEKCHKPTKEFFNTKPPHAKGQFIFDNITQNSCTPCHADFHKGQLGNQCSKCHNENEWAKVSFDHNKQSSFKITGKHIGVKCEKCHKPIPKEFSILKSVSKPLVRFKPLSSQCTTCHKDPHNGHYGNQCQECHMDKGWKVTKDFHKGFALSGVHYSLQCQECHKDNRILAGASRECILCHQKDDIHQGTLPNCERCHKQQFWENADFKHSLTLFPLRGAHRGLECASCHRRGVYQGTSSRCVDCHLSDGLSSSVHPQVLPNFSNCAQCHNQFAW